MSQKTKYTPKVYYKGKELPFVKVPLTVTSGKPNPFKCSNCEKEITINQIEAALYKTGCLNKTQTKLIEQVLPYINKYRKDFGLNTCLRKAHFIAQICVESSSFTTLEEDDGYYYTNNIPGIFSTKNIIFNSTIANSLKENLQDIIKITDSNNKVLSKTNSEIKKLMLDEKVQVVDKQLYAKYKNGEKLLKEVKEIVKKNGKDVEQTKYKIYLKNHKVLRVPLMSRAYAPFAGDKRGLGNGDELTRDGWKFKGRGLKQVTGRYNYGKFSNDRNKWIDKKKGFPEDDEKIDFTKEKNVNDLTEGNYLKLSNDPKFATQSALWFWIKGTPKAGKHAKDYADLDDVDGVTNCVNAYTPKSSKDKRKEFYHKARRWESFDINNHFKEMYQKGNANEKKQAREYFLKWAKKDKESKEIWDELKPKAVETITKGIKTIELKIEAGKIVPVNTSSNSKKKGKRN